VFALSSFSFLQIAYGGSKLGQILMPLRSVTLKNTVTVPKLARFAPTTLLCVVLEAKFPTQPAICKS
jgi:hypothetical protein